jgi:hypothetical protein
MDDLLDSRTKRGPNDLDEAALKNDERAELEDAYYNEGTRGAIWLFVGAALVVIAGFAFLLTMAHAPGTGQQASSQVETEQSVAERPVTTQ